MPLLRIRLRAGPGRRDDGVADVGANIMRVGLILPISLDVGQPLRERSVASAAESIEGWGFDGAWVFDALGRGLPMLDPLIALSVAATVTTTIELGTCIFQIPLRPPAETAHRVHTAHLVCGDRLSFGVGAGSTRADFECVGADFDRRHRTFQDSLELVRRHLRGEDCDGTQLSPWPSTSRGPRILIGSWAGGTWVRRAAEEFDGWIASAAATDLATNRQGIARYAAAGGKRAVLTNVKTCLWGDKREPIADDVPFNLLCDVAEAAERLRMIESMGYTDVVLNIQGDWFRIGEFSEALLADVT